MLSVDDLGDGLRLAVQVTDDIEPGRVCEFMRAALTTLVDTLESEPGRAVRTLDVLPAGERAQLVSGWNATDVAYPAGTCLHELFEAQAARTPRTVAVSSQSGSLTYAELNQRANRLARRLHALGVGPDDQIGRAA